MAILSAPALFLLAPFSLFAHISGQLLGLSASPFFLVLFQVILPLFAPQLALSHPAQGVAVGLILCIFAFSVGVPGYAALGLADDTLLLPLAVIALPASVFGSSAAPYLHPRVTRSAYAALLGIAAAAFVKRARELRKDQNNEHAHRADVKGMRPGAGVRQSGNGAIHGQPVLENVCLHDRLAPLENFVHACEIEHLHRLDEEDDDDGDDDAEEEDEEEGPRCMLMSGVNALENPPCVAESVMSLTRVLGRSPHVVIEIDTPAVEHGMLTNNERLALLSRHCRAAPLMQYGSVSSARNCPRGNHSVQNESLLSRALASQRAVSTSHNSTSQNGRAFSFVTMSSSSSIPSSSASTVTVSDSLSSHRASQSRSPDSLRNTAPDFIASALTAYSRPTISRFDRVAIAVAAFLSGALGAGAGEMTQLLLVGIHGIPLSVAAAAATRVSFYSVLSGKVVQAVALSADPTVSIAESVPWNVVVAALPGALLGALIGPRIHAVVEERHVLQISACLLAALAAGVLCITSPYGLVV